MTVVSGVLTVRLPGRAEWPAYAAGGAFIIEKNEKFRLRVAADAAYLYLCR